jgi:hypothetical protein
VARQVAEDCEHDVDEQVHAAAGDGEDAERGELGWFVSFLFLLYWNDWVGLAGERGEMREGDGTGRTMMVMMMRRRTEARPIVVDSGWIGCLGLVVWVVSRWMDE